MTHLRKMMLEELQRRNYSAATIRCYIRTVEEFSRRFHSSPDRLGPRHIREYQAELFEKRKLSAASVAVCLAALRFFYCKTLRKSWSIFETPYPKKDHRLPTILSQQEVARLMGPKPTPNGPKFAPQQRKGSRFNGTLAEACGSRMQRHAEFQALTRNSGEHKGSERNL